jgi:hypothetical protein
VPAQVEELAYLPVKLDVPIACKFTLALFRKLTVNPFYFISFFF